MKSNHQEIERKIKIEFDCAMKHVPQDMRDVYLRGWLDAEQLSGHTANPDNFNTLVCNCGHRKEKHIPNKVRQDAGYATCMVNNCTCNERYP